MNHDQILAAIPDAVIVADTSTGRILEANPAAGDLFGMGLDQLATLTVDDLVPEDLRHAHRRHVERYRDAPERRDIAERGVLYAVHSSGRRIPVAISLSPAVVDELSVTVASIRDLSQLMAAEARRQADASRRLELEVRLAIARDLHDSVIQQLFAAGASLAAVSRRFAPTYDQAGAPGSSDSDDPLGGVADLIDRAIVALRDAIGGGGYAAPANDGHLGKAVVAAVAEMTAALPNLPEIRLSSDLPHRVSPDLVADVAHVVREGLANTARHAKADSVGVSVEVEYHPDARLVVTVWDDGVAVDGTGVPDTGVPDTGHFGHGLDNLAARAARRGGRSQFRPRRSGGSSLRWEVPIADSAARRG